MAQIQKGTTYTTGDQVTAANLNALADAAILLPGAITDQTAKTVPLAADTILLHSAADTALRKSTLTQLFSNATGIPLTTGVTGILPAANGGTGVANANTLTLAGNVTHAGAFTQSFTATANTALTLPTTGTLATLAGSEALSNKTITASAFNGTVGATTASTGAFTTLSASSTVTFRDTANTYSLNVSGVGGTQIVAFGNSGGVPRIQAFTAGFAAATQLDLNPAGGLTTIGAGLAVTGALSTTGASQAACSLTMLYSAIQAGTIGITSNGAMAFGLDGSTGTTERMRISTSGNVGIGVTPSASSACTNLELPYGATLSARSNTAAPQFAMMSNAVGNWYAPTYKINGYATQYTQQGFDGSHAWYTAASGTAGNAIAFAERARIDSSGNLLVGTTSALNNSIGLSVQGAQTGGGAGVITGYNSSSSAADNSPVLVLLKAMTTTSSSARFVQFYADSTTTPMGAIVGNGSGNVQFATLSDAREKTNIQSITGSLDKVLALKPVSFDWISNSEHTPAGFVAQDVKEVFPEFVVDNMANEGSEQRYGLTGGLNNGVTAHLVKALQELNANLVAELQSLRQRVAALESN